MLTLKVNHPDYILSLKVNHLDYQPPLKVNLNMSCSHGTDNVTFIECIDLEALSFCLLLQNPFLLIFVCCFFVFQRGFYQVAHVEAGLPIQPRLPLYPLYSCLCLLKDLDHHDDCDCRILVIAETHAPIRILKKLVSLSLIS